MKKLYILILFQLLYITNSVFAQDFWEILPVPDTLDLTSMVVNDENEIFISTNNEYFDDGIYKSGDGGYNWQKMFDSGQFGIMSMAVSDSGVIYAVGKWDGIDMLKSLDNGSTWTVIDVPDCLTNQRIFLKGEDTIFVSQWRSEGAFLLRSIDGGQNWDLVFQDNGTQYIVDMAIGTDGSIYVGLMCYMPNAGGVFKSSDGGTNWEFLGLYNHQVSSISIDSSNNLLITVWSNMIDISISGNFYYNHLTNEFIPLCYAWGAWGSTINSNNEFFTTYDYGALHSLDGGLTFYPLVGGDTVAGCELYLNNDEYIYGLAHSSNYLVKSLQPTVTGIFDKNPENNLLKITPNPIINQIIGYIKPDINENKAEVELIDVTGKTLLRKEVRIENGTFQVDVSTISTGIYLIYLRFNGSSYSAKIVKS